MSAYFIVTRKRVMTLFVDASINISNVADNFNFCHAPERADIIFCAETCEHGKYCRPVLPDYMSDINNIATKYCCFSCSKKNV